MVAEKYTIDQPLTKKQVKELEVKISEGDLHSMAIFTYDALKFHLNDTKLLEYRKWLVIRADHQGNRSILRNVASLAAYTNDIDMTDFLIPLFYEINDFSSPFYISNILRNSSNPASIACGNLYLQKVAKCGHFAAKSMLYRDKTKRWGVLGYIGWLGYMVFIGLRMVPVLILNKNDPRILIK